jgi:hypothetical protein
VIAGGVSVLMPLKASVDVDVDLRTHDPDRQSVPNDAKMKEQTLNDEHPE